MIEKFLESNKGILSVCIFGIGLVFTQYKLNDNMVAKLVTKDDLQKRIEGFARVISEKDATIQKLKLQIEILNDEIIRLRLTIGEKDNKIIEKEEELQRLKERLKRYEDNIEDKILEGSDDNKAVD